MRIKTLLIVFVIFAMSISLSSCTNKSNIILKPKKEMQLKFSMSMQGMECREAEEILTELKASYPKDAKPFEYVDPLSNAKKALSYGEMEGIVKKCKLNEMTPDDSLIFSSFVARSIADIKYQKYGE